MKLSFEKYERKNRYLFVVCVLTILTTQIIECRNQNLAPSIIFLPIKFEQQSHKHHYSRIDSILLSHNRESPLRKSSSCSSLSIPAQVLLCRGGAAGSSLPPSSSSSRSPFGPRVAPSFTSSQSSSVSSRSTTATADYVRQQQKQQPQEEADDRQISKDMMDAFLTRDSRNSFIARVYAILAGQLIVTAASVFLFGIYPELSSWMRRPGLGASVPILSLVLSTIAWIIISVSPMSRRTAPVKWQLLALFTLGEALSVGFVSSFYHFRSVLSAMLATAVAASSVSIYTVTQKNPKYDLSQWGSMLSSFGLIFVVYGFIQILQLVGVLPTGFLPYNDLIYGLVGSTLFSCYLAYHTKLIVAGKHAKYQMNEKDYVFGAMTLYNDIINLFIYLLRIMGSDKDD